MKLGTFLARAIWIESMLCLLLLVVGLTVGHLVRADSSPAFGAQRFLVSPAGVYPDGARSQIVDGAMRCQLVRFAGDGCRFCQSDLGSAGKLAKIAVSVGCSAIGVAPSRYEVPKNPGPIPVLEFVGMEWVRNRLNLVAEPTTLIISRDGALVWSHVGQLSPNDLKAATAVIRRLASAR